MAKGKTPKTKKLSFRPIKLQPGKKPKTVSRAEGRAVSDRGAAERSLAIIKRLLATGGPNAKKSVATKKRKK